MFYNRAGLTALLGLVLVTLSACGGGPPPKLYLLVPPVFESDLAARAADSIEALGISEVILPGYAADERIATMSTSGVVSQLDDQRWAEEPEEAITRLLAKQLEQHGAQIVLREPWPRDYEPEARVEVSFGRLLREEHGGASFSGQIQLLSADGRALLQQIPFEFAVLGESTDSREFFRAVATGVDEIALMVIEALLSANTNT